MFCCSFVPVYRCECAAETPASAWLQDWQAGRTARSPPSACRGGRSLAPCTHCVCMCARLRLPGFDGTARHGTRRRAFLCLRVAGQGTLLASDEEKHTQTYSHIHTGAVGPRPAGAAAMVNKQTGAGLTPALQRPQLVHLARRPGLLCRCCGDVCWSVLVVVLHVNCAAGDAQSQLPGTTSAPRAIVRVCECA